MQYRLSTIFLVFFVTAASLAVFNAWGIWVAADFSGGAGVQQDEVDGRRIGYCDIDSFFGSNVSRRNNGAWRSERKWPPRLLCQQHETNWFRIAQLMKVPASVFHRSTCATRTASRFSVGWWRFCRIRNMVRSTIN